MDKYIYLVTMCIKMLIFSGSLKANGILLDEIVIFLNTTHSRVAWAMSFQNGLAYMIAPFTIPLLDVYSSRSLCIVGGVLSGLGYIYCGLRLQSIWHLFIGYGISGIGLGISVLPSVMLLLKFFGPNEFPIAMSVFVMFENVGISILPAVLQILRNQYGLQNSLIVFGAVVWNTVVMGVAAKEPHIATNYVTDEAVSDAEGEDTPSSKKNQEAENMFQKVRLEMSSFLKHKHALIIIVIESVSLYLFVSWALFLVPVGKTFGFSDFEAVSLSSFGGIGGLIGRVVATLMFYFQKMNAVTSSFVPLLATGVTLLLTVMFRSYYLVSGVVFICGMSQAVVSSGMYGLISTMVCPRHYKAALAAECFLGGFAMQLSGLISGYIRDLTGSGIYVFVVNGAISVSLTPVAILWAFNSNPNLNCEIPNRQ
ncbi:monocarboxylate transporter 2-like [Apostichopus japonicus]|uniref:monocarboxylate transporter 2-like n=1 Tax=Stichopus japonicus TaxID=307972 RepID=UPI003AB514CD